MQLNFSKRKFYAYKYNIHLNISHSAQYFKERTDKKGVKLRACYQSFLFTIIRERITRTCKHE